MIVAATTSRRELVMRARSDVRIRETATGVDSGSVKVEKSGCSILNSMFWGRDGNGNLQLQKQV